jgi:hypothetical protein
LLAQKDTSVVIKAGQTVGDVLGVKEIYRYPQFKTGLVSFVDGRNSTARLNYNMLYGEMEFISPDHDTLALDNEKLLKWVLIDKDTFYFSENYLLQLSSYGSKKIAQNKDWKIVRMDKVGAFDQPVFAGADAYGLLSDRRSVKLTVRENLTLALKPYFFIGDRQKFYPLNKKNIMRLYPKYDKIISAYLEQEQIDYGKENDVLKLFNYLQSIDK